MDAELDTSASWIPLLPAAALTGRTVRELLELVNVSRIPAFVDRTDGRRRLVFRAADLKALGPTA